LHLVTDLRSAAADDDQLKQDEAWLRRNLKH
jgi:hypothetical protein